MLLIIILATSYLLTLAYLFTNYTTLSPSIPGPFLARFTDFWRAYYQYKGELRPKLISLHAQHGPIIRYGIRSISISDPKAIDILYGSRAGFVTADSYKVLLGIKDGKEVASLVSTQDETRHGQLRRGVASAFTVQGTQDYERFVDATIPDLLDAIRKYRGQQIDLPDMMMLYSMDSATRMLFSESLGCLRSGEDVGGNIAMIRDRFRHWGLWSSLPWLERLLFRNPWSMRRSVGRTPAAVVSSASQKLAARLSEKDGEEKDLLQRFIQAHHEHPDLFDQSAVIGLLMSTISGAGDTTAVTMTALLYYLIKDPETLARLRQELTDADVSKEKIPAYHQVSKLPYLSAAIKEAMRLLPVSNTPIERRIPFGGVTVAGQYLPAGASAGIFPPALHLERAVFGEDAEHFRPERWLDPDADKIKRMEQASMGFSRGRRVCLGQNVAVMQMKKVIPALVLGFDFAFVHEDAWLHGDMTPMVLCLKPLWVTAKDRE